MRKLLLMAIVLIAMLGTICFLVRKNQSFREERDRLAGNMETLMRKVVYYKVQDSLNVAFTSALNLTIDELKRYRSDDAKLIRDLGIKNKDLKSLIKLGIHTSDTIRVDKWHPAPNNPDCLEYFDRWATITACSKDSTVMYSVRDSLAMVVHRIPKRKFLWWSWGTKGYRMEVVNFNPKSKIQYTEIIRIER